MRVVSSSPADRLPTEEEWQGWEQHPVTQTLARYLHKKQEEIRAAWAKGAFGNQVHLETVVLNSVAQGMHQCIDQILDLEYGQIVAELSDE